MEASTPMKRRQDPKIKLTVYVSRIVADQLDLACKDRTKNKSKLTETALSQLLSPNSDDQQDDAMPRRLDRLTRDVSVINRHQQIVIESFGLFIRHYLMMSPSCRPRSIRQPRHSVSSASNDSSNSSADGSQAQQRLRMKSPSSDHHVTQRQAPKCANASIPDAAKNSALRRTVSAQIVTQLADQDQLTPLARWAVAPS